MDALDKVTADVAAALERAEAALKVELEKVSAEMLPLETRRNRIERELQRIQSARAGDPTALHQEQNKETGIRRRIDGYLREHGQARKKAIRDALGLNEVQVTNALQDMVENDLVERVVGEYGTYRIKTDK